jgi:hypothetical protein
VPRQVDAARLRKTILSRMPDAWIIQNSGLNRAIADYAAHERMEPPYPSTTWIRCQTITDEWWARKATLQWSPELAYRYTVLQASLQGRLGGGVAWSVGPHPDGRWELGVPSFAVRLGELMDRAGDSILGTRPSKAFPTTPIKPGSNSGPPLAGLRFAATESAEGRTTFIHCFLPPKGQSLELPPTADGRKFAKARLLPKGTRLTLESTPTGLLVTLPKGARWDDVDTILRLDE